MEINIKIVDGQQATEDFCKIMKDYKSALLKAYFFVMLNQDKLSFKRFKKEMLDETEVWLDLSHERYEEQIEGLLRTFAEGENA